MVAAAAPTRPPAAIEDFLWNVHSVVVNADQQPLPLDQFKEVYSKQLGHKCVIERFLVVGEGGLATTLKRIPHIITVCQENGVACMKPSLAEGITKQGLIDADLAYRREIVKRNAEAAKAMGKAKAKAAPATAPKAAPATAPKAAAAPAVASPSAETGADEADDAKRQKTGDSNAETLTKMLVQGVVRVLQNRQKSGKGPLPLDELEEEFKALWKVPFNFQQAGEKDALTFLRKWPNKIDVLQEGAQTLLQLSKKPGDKAKAGADAKAGEAAKPPAAAKSAAPAAAPLSTAAKSSAGAPPSGSNGGAPKASSPEDGSKAATKPPVTIEEFLWHMHSLLEACGPTIPLDKLKEQYAAHHGHKCVIEKFLVVGEGGIGATLKRIPHIVTVFQEKDEMCVKATQPAGTTREQLVAADQAYRRQLQQRNAAAKAQAKAGPLPGKAAAPPPKAATAAAPADAPVGAAKAATAAAAAAPAGAQKRPASETAGGDAKRPRPEDADTLAKMLVQGVVRVLQNRAKEGRGPLPIANLEEEFKANWKVPFNLQQAGETDTVEFLQKWPSKVDVVNDGTQQVVQLAKKQADKAKAAPSASKAPGAAATPAASAAASPKAVGTGSSAIPSMRTLPEIRQQAASMLQKMQEMLRQQEAFVAALNQLDSEA